MIKKFLKPVGRGIPATVDPLVKRAVVQLEEHTQDLAARASSLETGHIWLSRQTFTASGFYQPTPGTALVVVRGVGAGGNGGAATGGAGRAAGAGGASGVSNEYRITGPIAGGAVTIGAISGSSSGNGGASTIVVSGVTYTFNGGGGGATMASSTTISTSLPGVATGTGAAQLGSIGLIANSSGCGGNGGSSPFGIGGLGKQGPPVGASGNGGNASGFGAGGGGALADVSSTSGGNATPGLIIVDEYR